MRSGLAAHLGVTMAITGTGRCGTKYMSRLLNRNRVTCSHEEVFHHDRGVTPRREMIAESSWAAAPYLSALNCPVVHLVRHPLRVLASMVGLKRSYFAAPPHQRDAQFLGHWVPRRKGETPAELAARFIVTWNLMIEPNADIRIRVEDMPDVELLQKLGATLPIMDVPHDTNHKQPFRGVGPLPDTGPIRELRAMTERYGYEWEP